MGLFSGWRRDHEALEQAKQAEAAAEQRLQAVRARAPEAHATARWAEETVRENHLTDRFLNTLRGRHA